VITSIEFEIPEKRDEFLFYKASQRKDLDISCMNAAVYLKRDAKKRVVGAKLAMGGVAPIPLRLRGVEKILLGGRVGDEEKKRALIQLQKEIAPISDLRGSVEYRRVLAENFLKSILEKSGVL
jgi:xanthine dehydrogenase small subunit